MRDAPGELADRLLLLRLPQLSLRTLLLLHFVDEFAVCELKGFVGLYGGHQNAAGVPEKKRPENNRQNERDQRQKTGQMVRAQRLRLRFGEDTPFLGVHPLHRVANALHRRLAAIRLHERERSLLLS